MLRILLVPDAGAARRVRRVLAERGGRSGVVVGTWPELVERARHTYLLPEPSNESDGRFLAVLEQFEDAFWTESFAVAPAETSEAVKSALIQLVSATDPEGELVVTGLEELAGRPRQHVKDLLRLAEALDKDLPAELSMMRGLFAATVDDALTPIQVYHRHDTPGLTRWQGELIEKLNRDAGGQVLDADLTGVLNTVSASRPAANSHSALGVLQERLFGVYPDKVELDESVQWIGVRDFLQEAEVAAGMVQTMLSDQSALMPSDIGLLVPDSFEYATALEDVFHLGGIALSGLPVERWRRDLGREAVFHFLYCRQKPAPAMALATCLSSPLMPWGRAEGAALAQTVMDGDYRLRALPAIRRDGRAMLDLLKGGGDDPASLVGALQNFASLLQGGEGLAEHVQQARAAVEQLRDWLENVADIDWMALRRAVGPRFIASGEAPDFNREGVTVWRESQEAWRPVKCLIVLGFTQGHFPSALGSAPVFSDDDLNAIRKLTHLPIGTTASVLRDRRLRFKRQLSAVTESVTFVISRRDSRGETQSPSESLVFMHQLFLGPESADERILELDAADDRKQIRHLALAAPEHPEPPRALSTNDLALDRDLLALRKEENGDLKPESPSSLETLMVSRLAWLLHRLDAEPRVWAPESANVMLLGTLAHKVFEGLFRSGEPLPDATEIPEHVEQLLEEAIVRQAPFLRAAQWQVERRHFTAETTKAAQAWRDVLERLGAEVLAPEEWVRGEWAGIPIRGQTDLIVGLPGGRLLVVDYKRSSSANRLPRMQKGYDSQASLYRAMLKTEGPKDEMDETLHRKVRAATHTGIVYFMLNDQVSLSDSPLPNSIAVPGWQTVENDVAGRAMALIEQRLAEVRGGAVCLNRDGDDEFFNKQAGLKPYALESGPLISLFTLPGEAEEAQ